MKNLNSLFKKTGFIILFFGMCYPAMAQLANPLQTDPSVWNSRELMVIWGQAGSGNDVDVKQAIFGVNYIDYLQAGTSPFITRVPEQTISTSVLDPRVRPMAAQSGDYDNDGEDEVVYAVSESDHIKITAPPVSKVLNPDSTISIDLQTPTSSVEVTTGVDANFTPGRGIPLLTKGDFDGDGADEFALAARKSDGTMIVQLIDMDGGSEPLLKASDQNEASVLDDYNAEVFDICSGDFDNDGKDEIALVTLKNSTGAGDYSVFLRLFDVSGTNCSVITPKGSLIVDDQNILPVSNDGPATASVKVAVQRIKNLDSADKLLVSFGFSPNDGDTQSNYYLKLMDVSNDLSDITELDGVDGTMNLYHSQGMDIKCGDLNGDGKDNAALMIGGDFRIYSDTGNVLTLNTVSNEVVYQSDEDEYETDNFEISDIDKNGRQNLLYTYTLMNQPNYGDRTLYIKSVEFKSDFSDGTVIEKQVALAEDYPYSQFYFGFTTGNFDGDDLILGPPETFTCVYRRPMFILAPPPIHFDHIDGVNYDESGCFTGDDCLFYASNTILENTHTELKLIDKSDWNVSATVSAGYEGLAVSVGASMTAKYGEQFSNESTSANTQQVEMVNTVTVDDFIKGVQYPVDVYEYPVYNANGDLINYVTAAFPHYDELEDYQQQGKLDKNYIPYYEPGNLLSYPPIDTITDFDEFSPGAKIYAGPIYTMSNNQGQSSNANITVDHVYGSTGSESWTAGVSASLSASGFGMGFESSGEYNQSGMKINSTTISGTDGFSIHYDNIGGPSGFNAYSVKPYLFWNKDGAGMLAYQVNIASSQSAPTWWDINYGSHPDPALMLPKHNEVYYTTGADPDSPIFTESKSMTFNRLYPTVGDEVTVTCRVFNYSLMDTPGPVSVSFYNGNPDEGGEILQSLEGQTVFQTSEAIPARGKSTVSMTFSMPLPVVAGESFVRFYAIVDPDDALEEVHENNNIGWQTIGYDCDSGSGTNSVYEYYNPEKYREMWVWPNPATDQVNLAFNIAASSKATLEIFDMQGKKVLIKDLGNISSGQQKVAVDLPEVAPGLYFVELRTKEFRKTQKLMIR